MISLNGVTLSPDLVILDEFAETAAMQSVKRTLDGGVVIQTMPISGGTVLKLGSVEVSGGISGYFSRAQIQQIKSLEQSANSVILVYGTRSYTVIVLAGGVAVQPVLDRPDIADTDWYTGSITLLVV